MLSYSNAQFPDGLNSDFKGKFASELNDAYKAISDIHVLKLRHLGKSDQQIYSLSDSICLLKNLESLDLLGNHLSKLPNCFTSLKRLKEINLSMNDFEKFPNELLALDSLKIALFYITYID